MKKKLFAATLLAVSATAVAVVPLTASATGNHAAPSAASSQSAQRPSACTPAQPPAPTTVTPIGQAFYCILDHYYDGPRLDERALLTSAFAGFTQELQCRASTSPGPPSRR